MKVYYHKTDGCNVGDDMNAVLWHRALPALGEVTSAEWLIGAGTIIDARLKSLPGRKIVMGSGFRPGAKRERFSEDVRFGAVRGFMTAAQCGLGADAAVCDPGFMVGRLWPQERAQSEQVGFIPHVYSERYSNIASAAQDAGFEVISPTLALEPFLLKLSRCARIYTESLHGAIFADALRVPWARMRVCSAYYEGNGVADFKWADAFSVFDMPVDALNRTALIPIKRSWSSVRKYLRPLQAIAERRLVGTLVRHRDDSAAFHLSDAGRLEERVERLMARVQQLSSLEHVRNFPASNLGVEYSSRARTGTQRLRVLAFPKAGENPYLSSFATTLEKRGADVDDFNFRRAWSRRYDVVHMHWPDTHLRTNSWWRALGKHARLLSTCALLRVRGARIVWMMHNLEPHEKDHWLSAALFPLWFPRACTHVMALTHTGLTSARRMYAALETKPAAVIPHGHYRETYPVVPPRRLARRELGIPEDGFTFLFFGSIRPYKNVPLLLQTFRQIAARDVQLVVAGLPVRGMTAQDVRARAEGDDRIHLHLKFIPDEQVPLYLAAADRVILPFDSVLNSGSVLLALSLNRSVLAPCLGSLPELQTLVGSRWLQLYEGQLTPQLLVEARSDTAQPAEDEAPDLGAFDWDAIGRMTLDFYQSGSSFSEQVRTTGSSPLGQSPWS